MCWDRRNMGIVYSKVKDLMTGQKTLTIIYMAALKEQRIMELNE
ncbi:hypothetical protein [Methanospirillum stamsii]|nr:hypothetical protein [Methanospirillum stamsii]